MNDVLCEVSRDIAGEILGTGYIRFRCDCGIEGLAKESGTRLDVLAVVADSSGTGAFREFIRRAKARYNTVCVWLDENPIVSASLARYGFSRETEIQPDGEAVTGWRWDAPPVS